VPASGWLFFWVRPSSASRYSKPLPRCGHQPKRGHSRAPPSLKGGLLISLRRSAAMTRRALPCYTTAASIRSSLASYVPPREIAVNEAAKIGKATLQEHAKVISSCRVADCV
jgi:hypothetical protein